MIERQEDAFLGDDPLIVDSIAETVRGNRRAEQPAGAMRLERQVADARCALHHPRPGVAVDGSDRALSILHSKLDETQNHSSRARVSRRRSAGRAVGFQLRSCKLKRHF